MKGRGIIKDKMRWMRMQWKMDNSSVTGWDIVGWDHRESTAREERGWGLSFCQIEPN